MTAGAKTAKSRRYIADLKAGETIEGQVFLVSKKDLRTTTNGSLYIHAVLVDRTGQLLARVWNATQEQHESIPEGGFITVRGRVESYKGSPQFIIDGMRPAEAGSYDPADFMPTTKYDVEAMWNEVLGILRTIKNPHLVALIKEFVTDQTIVTNFKRAPAAVQFHHAFVGGLLEHTLCVLRVGTRIFGAKDDSESLYPEVSRDLVLSGVFLHDIGKTAELSYDTNFAYTSGGQLIGHITQAAIWIDRKIAEVETKSGQPFPEDIQNVLTHIVLAHHGTYEFGSPRLPACPEAIAVHYLDNIDAKMQMSLADIREAKNAESDWTEFNRALGTRIYKKDVMGIRAKPGKA